MKPFTNYLKALFLLFIGACCCIYAANAQDSKKVKDSLQAVAVKNLIEAKNYVFEVQSVTPMKGGTRQLTTGYTLKVLKDTVISDMPYFGRAYQASLDMSDAGVKFVSTDFEYTTVNRKKGGWDVSIKPNDVRNFKELTLTIYDNGSASLYVTPNDRQSISYRGYITGQKQK
ncbi:MAG TPA: DUF4251 domain-containing protein [Panacibacter sp.]|nr:DUF4251 domain-containing protein [Panacibacter sp.]